MHEPAAADRREIVEKTLRKRVADLEAMATAMVYAIPGGSICDPQQISDALREIAAKHGVTVKDE